MRPPDQNFRGKYPGSPPLDPALIGTSTSCKLKSNIHIYLCVIETQRNVISTTFLVVVTVRGDDFPGVELDDLLQQFDGNFENLMDTLILWILMIFPQISPPRNEFPVTQKKNIKRLQQPFQSPTIVLQDLETRVQVDYLRNPIDFFLQYFENDFFEIVAFNISLYTVQNNKTNFKPTNKYEIQTLIAIHLIMG
ncbi:piggyBac transposable element-derived protein 3-like, partial [Aphis craccivora]